MISPSIIAAAERAALASLGRKLVCSGHPDVEPGYVVRVGHFNRAAWWIAARVFSKCPVCNRVRGGKIYMACALVQEFAR